MSAVLARAPAGEDAMTVDAWQPASPEQQPRAAERYSPTSPPIVMITTIEMPQTPEPEPKRRCLASTNPPDAVACASMAQPERPTSPSPVPASSLPDELLLHIFSFAADLAPAAQVCRRWLPAATQELYSSVSLRSDEPLRMTSLTRTLWNATNLRALVRNLYVVICVTDDPVDVETLLGWSVLVPAEPGFNSFGLDAFNHTQVAASTLERASAILQRAPALRNVRQMHLNGATTASLLGVPRRLESLYLSNHVDLTLPPLPHLTYISIHNSSVVILDGSKYDQLRTFELRETTSSIALDRLDQWAPALRNLLLPWDSSMSEDEVQIFANSLQRVPPSVRILDLCVPVALQLSSFGAVEVLQISMGRWWEDDIHDVRDIIVTAARTGTLKVVRIVSLDLMSEHSRKVIEDMKLRVRVDFAEVLEDPSYLELDL